MAVDRAAEIKTELTARLDVSGDAPPADVSVVIPCLNEAKSISFCVEKAIKSFQAAGLRGEVVVADNGSTDGSIEIAGKLGARVVRVEQRGYGAALRAGICASRGAFIIMGDADDSYDFSDVPRFVEMWRQGYDVVMGNRFRGEIKPGAMPWHHKYVGNPALTSLLNLFFHAHIGDSHCGCVVSPARSTTAWTYAARAWNSLPNSSSRPRNSARASRKFPLRCGQTSAAAPRIFAASGTAGATCDSCCFTLQTGFFFCREGRLFSSAFFLSSGSCLGRATFRRAWFWIFTR